MYSASSNVLDLCVPMKFNSSSFGVLVTLIIVLLDFGNFTEKKFIIQPCTTENCFVKLLRRFRHEYHHRLKRGSLACNEDLLTLDMEKIAYCIDATENFNDGNISDSDINSFCSQDCGRFLVRTAETLEEDCDQELVDDEVTPPSQEDLEILKASCYQDPKGNYCLYDWANPNTFYDSDYETCLKNNDGRCTEECAQAVEKITTTYGCCYSYFNDLEDNEYLIQSSVFAACDSSVPEHCIDDK